MVFLVTSWWEWLRYVFLLSMYSIFLITVYYRQIGREQRIIESTQILRRWVSIFFHFNLAILHLIFVWLDSASPSSTTTTPRSVSSSSLYSVSGKTYGRRCPWSSSQPIQDFKVSTSIHSGLLSTSWGASKTQIWKSCQGWREEMEGCIEFG